MWGFLFLAFLAFGGVGFLLWLMDWDIRTERKKHEQREKELQARINELLGDD